MDIRSCFEFLRQIARYLPHHRSENASKTHPKSSHDKFKTASKFQINDDLAVDARVGGFANYDVFGKVKYTVKSQGDEETESISLGDAVDAGDRFGAGIQFGVGVWYQHLNFNITYQKGLVDQFDGAKENNWMLSLGYAF